MNAPRLDRGIVPVRDLDEAVRFHASDPTGDPLCFVDERTLFTGHR